MNATLEQPSEASRTVEKKLRRAWHRERSYFHLRGFLCAVAWTAGLLALAWLVDWMFDLPGWGRLAFLGIGAVLLVWVFYRQGWRYLKSYDSTRVALEVENRHPDLESLLVSYVQLRGAPDEQHNVSPALIRALERQAVEATRPLDFRDVVNFAELRRFLIVALLIVGFFALASVNWSGHFRVLVTRLLDPQSVVKYPTRTRVEVLTKDVTVKQGDNLTIRARAAGLVPREGALMVKVFGGGWQKLIVKQQEGKEFAREFEGVTEDFVYYFQVGDAKTESYRATVVPPPRLSEARIRLHYPAYTRTPDRTVGTLSPDAVEGTEIEWNLRFSTPLSKVEMLREGAGPLSLELNAEGTGAVLRLTAQKSFAYKLRWTEREHGFTYDQGVDHSVRVDPDLPPEVELLQPVSDEKATIRKTAPISFRTVDDYGVTKAWIVFSVNDGEEKRTPIEPFGGGPLEGFQWRVRDSITSLKEGDNVSYAIEVADNYEGPGGPRRARSESRRLAILSIPEYEKHVKEMLATLTDEIRAVHGVETQASEQMKVIQAGTTEEKK